MPAHAAHKLALLRPYILRPGVHFDYGLEPPYLRVPRSTLSPAIWRCLILLGMALPACVAALAPRCALAAARRPCALLFALSAGLLFLVEDKSAYNNHDWSSSSSPWPWRVAATTTVAAEVAAASASTAAKAATAAAAAAAAVGKRWRRPYAQH
jgi:hypothetical protein